MFHFDNLSKYSFPIGTSGNWVRPSTGYAFFKIPLLMQKK